ncbi:MAG: hypothetical protein ACOC9T_01810 [Myxococcota bacterium]
MEYLLHVFRHGRGNDQRARVQVAVESNVMDPNVSQLIEGHGAVGSPAPAHPCTAGAFQRLHDETTALAFWWRRGFWLGPGAGRRLTAEVGVGMNLPLITPGDEQ